MKQLYLKPNYLVLILTIVLIGILIKDINFNQLAITDYTSLIFALILGAYAGANILNIMFRKPKLILADNEIIYETLFSKKTFDLKASEISYKKLGPVQYLEIKDSKKKVVIYKDQFSNVNLNKLESFVASFGEMSLVK